MTSVSKRTASIDRTARRVRWLKWYHCGRVKALLAGFALASAAGMLDAGAQAASAAPPSWSVMNPPHLQRVAAIDTDEGTWMNVDVSPDGATLVFDLLGDIYLLPIAGGEARQILGGMAWEAQPRFSPDGTRIAFVSDRSGVKNLWVYRLSDGALRQVSQEWFRTPSAPAWSRDGRSLIARKHYTSERTVGAGEIWRFPIDAGQPERLIEGESAQKDVNEPVYSADGNGIFFSKDTHPDLEFQYDRNVHQGLFSILRHDLQDGRQHIVISGAGGAVRPVPSPDGRWLAYVKRIGLDHEALSSGLVLRDLRSGADRVLDDRLDEDLQELWANDGYYPAFAWLPDSSAIVYWARGRLWRRGVDDRALQEIPFHVSVRHSLVATPPRQMLPLNASTFPVKALRWVTASPDGRMAAYQALGRIQLWSPAGVRRLTRDTDLQEFYPTFSPDGEWVVYTTWGERTLGSLRRTHVRTGETVVLSTEPAHYVEPAVARGGASVIVRKAARGRLLDPRWTVAPGIYEIPWAGGEATLLHESAKQPLSCDDEPMIFGSMEVPRPEKPPASWWGSDVELRRIDGVTAPPLISSRATEYRLSADCRWLARVEHGDIVVARVGRDAEARLSVAADGTQFVAPGDGGAYLSWSRDGTLHWSLGAQWFSWRIGVEGPRGAPTRRTIGFDAPVAKPTGTLVLRGGRIITMRGAETIEDGTVVIEGDRIVEVGATAAVKVPAHARVIELAGRTVIPGLFDNHGHVDWPSGHAEEGIQPRQNWGYYAFLALGITTIFDPSAPYDIFSAAESSRSGNIVAPRIYSTGPSIHDAKDAPKYARQRRAWGAIAIKSYLVPQRLGRQQLVEAARQERLSVVDEALMGGLDVMTQVLDGNTGAEHGLPLARIYADVRQLWTQADTDITPTLVTAFGGLGGRTQGYQQERVWQHPILSRYVPPDILRAASMRPILAQREDFRVLQMAAWLKQLAADGVRVLPSGHGEREGLGVLWDMQMLADGGMAPHDVIAGATIRSAEHLGLAGDLGSIEPGKLADLVVVEGDPLHDIRDLARVHAVIANGRHFDPMRMEDGPQRPREPFFWERTTP